MLRELSECGQSGVNTIRSASGATIGPPADRLYAVEPVGVATTMPSAEYSLNSCPLTASSNRNASIPIRFRTISFNAISSMTTGRTKVSLSFDGDTVVDIEPGDTIEIAKSEIETTLIQLKQVPFLENIRNKMKQI